MEKKEVSSVRSHHTLADIALILGPRGEQRVHARTQTHTVTEWTWLPACRGRFTLCISVCVCVEQH